MNGCMEDGKQILISAECMYYWSNVGRVGFTVCPWGEMLFPSHHRPNGQTITVLNRNSPLSPSSEIRRSIAGVLEAFSVRFWS